MMNEKRGSGIEINMLDPDQKREREREILIQRVK